GAVQRAARAPSPTRRSSDLGHEGHGHAVHGAGRGHDADDGGTQEHGAGHGHGDLTEPGRFSGEHAERYAKRSRSWSRRRFYRRIDRKSTRLNSSHVKISYAV